MAILHFKRGEMSLSHALNSGKHMLANQTPGTSLEIYCAGERVDMVITLTVQSDWLISESFDVKQVPKADPVPAPAIRGTQHDLFIVDELAQERHIGDEDYGITG